MDNLTHTLTAVALSQAGLNRKTRFSTLAMIVGANLPDADLVTRITETATYLKYHRGITHSFLGVTILSAFLAGVIYYFGRQAPPKKSAPPLDGRWLFGVSWIATASHVVLDFTNSYGVRPFLPFSGRWFAWDIHYIIDPLLLVLLGAGLGLPILFRLISEEVGATKPGFRRGAVFALCSLVLLGGIRDLAHRRVLSLLDSHNYGRESPREIGAFPTPLNPFAWTGVVETDSAYHVLEASALDEDVNPQTTRVFHKPEPSAALDAAMKTRTAAIFSDFARFPLARVEETEDGFRVTMRDLRFLALSSGHGRFVVDVELDRNLRVRSESFAFTREGRGREY